MECFFISVKRYSCAQYCNNFSHGDFHLALKTREKSRAQIERGLIFALLFACPDLETGSQRSLCGDMKPRPFTKIKK